MKNKYLYLFLISVIMMILSGCTLRTSDGFTSDEKSICVLQNGRSARIGNTVLYDCSEDYGTYIKLENSDVSRKLDDVSQNFAIDKISSSNQYFYLSGREISDVWGGKTNVLVMDVNGKIIAAKECCCDWIYASGSTIFGYYKCRDESEKVLAWEATRMEVTHYQDEEEFLNSAHNNIEEWTPMTGESLSVDGKEWFRQKKDYEHSQNYYTDTVYCDTYYVLEWLNYVDGRESSGLDWDVKVQSKKYIKQMRQTVSPAPRWWNGRPTLYYCWTAPAAVSSLTRYSQSSTARTARTVRYRDSLNWPGSRSSAAGHCPAPCAWTRTGPTSWRPWPASGSPGATSFIPAMISAGSPRQRRNWDTRCLSSRSGPVPPSVSPKSPGRKSCPPPWRRHSATTAP